jgi:ATP-dependent Clp protease ATP-binding subunit ClpC
MFERFTEKGVKSIMIGQEEARRSGRDFVSCEDILVGIILENTSVASTVLDSFEINIYQIRREVERLVGKKNLAGPTRDIPFAPNTRLMLERSMKIAGDFGQSYVAPEHMLLGIIAKPMLYITFELFQALKVNVQDLTKKLIAAMGADIEKMPSYNDGSYCESVDNNDNDNSNDNESDNDTYSKNDTNESGNEAVSLESIKEYIINLSSLAAQGNLDPVIGRSNEIARVINILLRRKKNNAILIGEPGVGKTSVAEGLALKIMNSDVPDLLIKKEIISLDISLLLAGTKFRGEFEERLKNVLQLIKKSKKIILVIDEVHTLIGAGAAEGGVDAANILKPILTRGELQCIGATTNEEYRKHIQKDPALERRFQPVPVPEPSIDETIQILFGLRHRYEKHHKVKILDSALIAATKLGSQFIADRFLPDKAIDLIDEAGSKVQVKGLKIPSGIQLIVDELEEIIWLKEAAVRDQAFEEAALYRAREIETEAQMKSVIEITKQYSAAKGLRLTVTEDDIADVVTAWTGIPVNKLSKDETEKLVNMEEILHKRVIGQDVAVSAIAKAIRRARVGLKNPARPIASFIFAGPTGVGKTELAKTLASFFFGSENLMVRLDMSEYMERHNISKLIGSPPGYVGYSEGGILTESIRRKPYSVVLFDEIEKAHPDVFNLLLQILEDGRLTDSQGRLIDFRNTLIILTSNIGSVAIEKETLDQAKNPSLLSSTTREKYDRMVGLVQEELKKHFKPEFLNRLDEIIVFQQLTQEDVRRIAEIMLSQLIKRVLEQFGIILTIERAVQDKLSVDGFNPTYGARPLRRVITSSLEDPLANLLLEKNFRAGTHLNVSLTEQNTFSMDVTGFTEPVPVFDSVNGKTNSERKPVVKSTRLYKLSSLSQYVKDERAKNAKLREEKEDKKREERDEKKL